MGGLQLKSLFSQQFVLSEADAGETRRTNLTLEDVLVLFAEKQMGCEQRLHDVNAEPVSKGTSVT